MNGPQFNNYPTRRFFLWASISLFGAAVFLRFKNVLKKKFPGKILGPNQELGHTLRAVPLQERHALSSEKIETVIVGGGISGLIAGWHLKKSGYENFVILDLEKEVGGNSVHGENKISAYPWAAHYVPLANNHWKPLLDFYQEMGIIQGYDKNHLPIYNEFFLCHDPEDRLFIHGQWQEGILPFIGLSEKDRSEYKRFFSLMEFFKNKRGKDGRFAFQIPLALSSQDEAFLQLDEISFEGFLKKNGFQSSYLFWYLNYCCRDDYGTSLKETSAWAGIHYFAGRKGVASNAKPGAVLTWPEGNGFFVKKLKIFLKGHIKTSALVYKIKPSETNNAEKYSIYFKNSKSESHLISSKNVIFAAPQFIADKIVEKRIFKNPSLKRFTYAPWLVSNLTVSEVPKTHKGLGLSWDNVTFHGQSLGYVVATHQNMKGYEGPTVLTHYWPLAQNENPGDVRKNLFQKPHSYWCDKILQELEPMHPGISHYIENIDIYFWGHAMIRPTPGFLWKDRLNALSTDLPDFHFAHTDLSGISIFEEAFYQGYKSAYKLLRFIKT